MLFGDDGNDTLDGANGNDAVSGGDGNDSLMGGAGNDTMDGGSGDDFIDGGSGADSVYGGDGSGSDTIVFDAMDTVDGGTGVDFLVVKTDIDFTTQVGNEFNGGPDQLVGLEGLSMDNSASNTVTLGVNDIISFMGTPGFRPSATGIGVSDVTLVITGDAGDTLNLEGAWLSAGSTTLTGPNAGAFQGGNYNFYHIGDTYIAVDPDIAVNIT